MEKRKFVCFLNQIFEANCALKLIASSLNDWIDFVWRLWYQDNASSIRLVENILHNIAYCFFPRNFKSHHHVMVYRTKRSFGSIIPAQRTKEGKFTLDGGKTSDILFENGVWTKLLSHSLSSF